MEVCIYGLLFLSRILLVSTEIFWLFWEFGIFIFFPNSPEGSWATQAIVGKKLHREFFWNQTVYLEK